MPYKYVVAMYDTLSKLITSMKYFDNKQDADAYAKMMRIVRKGMGYSPLRMSIRVKRMTKKTIEESENYKKSLRKKRK